MPEAEAAVPAPAMTRKPALQRNRLLAQMAFFTLFHRDPGVRSLPLRPDREPRLFSRTIPGTWAWTISSLAGRIGSVQAAGNHFLFCRSSVPWPSSSASPGNGAALLRLAVPAFLGGRNHQPADARSPAASIRSGIKQTTPPWEPDGTPARRDKRYWLAVVPAAVAFAFAWAVVGLTYLMPRSRSRPPHLQPHPLRSHLPGGGDRRAEPGISFRPPSFLPLRLRHRSLPELRLDGQPQGHGGRLRARAPGRCARVV